MIYGKFSSDGRSFDTEKVKTPLAWKNILFNDEYFMEASQRLCGASYAVEKYKRSPVLAEEKRFYIKLDEDIFQVGCGMGSNYKCTHSIHKSAITEEFEKFIVTVTVFVPTKGKKELWNIRIDNKTKQVLNTKVFAYFEFANIGYLSLECDYINGYFVKTSFPYHIKYDEYEQLKSAERKVYAMSNKKVNSYECSKNGYFGGDNPFSVPAMVENGCGSNKKCEYETCAAGFHHELIIDAEKSDSITYIAGQTENFDEIELIRKEMPDFDNELKAAEKKWLEDTAPLQIDTKYRELNILVNYWLKKQMIYLARHNRGGVYCPVRNQLQDAMGYAVLNPNGALELGLEVLRRQKKSGYLKQWYMTDGSPDIGLCLINHSDACVWLIMCMIEIIRLTGDNKNFYIMEKYSDSDTKETVFEHLRNAALYMSAQLGRHGLCLIKDGDWTDPINGAGRNGRGESAWNTLALIYSIRLLNEIKFDTTLESIKDKLTEAVNTYCWNEDRYIAGFDDDGIPFGCKGEKEAALFLNTQAWALIAGICGKERIKKVRETVETLKTDFGYLLLYPAFEGWNPRWGKISIKQKGNTENGSVYCHGNMFKAYADFLCGDPESGINTMLDILPTNSKNPPEVNRQIPTFLPNYYIGYKGDNFGHSSNVYSTGATAWMLWLADKYLKK